MLSRALPFVFFAASALAGEVRIPVEFVAPGGPAASAPAAPGNDVVDFRFAPPRWQTAICLPDDPQKTLVDSEGRLLYEFGNGPYDGFQTRIGVQIDGKMAGRGEQGLLDPRVPIVKTGSRTGDVNLLVWEFAAAPPARAEPEETAALERLDGEDTNQAWASPTIPCDACFRDVAVGWNRSIEYRFRAKPGVRYQVAFGLCEGWHADAGRRVEELRVERKTAATVDLVKDHGKNVPFAVIAPAADADGDGWILIEVAAAPASSDKNTVLNGLWIFEGDAPAADAVVRGEASGRAVASASTASTERVGPGGRARADILLAQAENKGAAPVEAAFSLVVESARAMSVDPARPGLVLRDGRPFLAVDPAPRSTSAKAGKFILDLAAGAIPAGGERRFAATVLLGSKAEARQVAGALAERDRAEAYWRGLRLPYDTIRVPDRGVQALVDSSIRNIYQAREIKRGLPAFQVGPTVYRGLWVVDGSFLMEAASYLGRLDEARAGLDYLLGFQKPDGSVQIMGGHWKETGIALWALWRHAQLTGDRAWLEKLWPRIRAAVAHVKALREESRKDPAAPEAGLIPRGFSDGGLGGVIPEYTNVYWTLVGLRAAVCAAEWLGTDDVKPWRAEYDDFFAAYRRAAERDMGTDEHGNRFVPIVMKGGPAASPQRAQWAFLHAIFPGKIFERTDPLATGTLAMLTATEREGLIYGTGWDAAGIWNYAGSFYAHAHLWMGNGRKAGDILYAFANHASPLLAWREEQSLQGGTNIVGDMPHNWASAEFIRLVRHLVVLERGNELHLLEGAPAAWARAGGDLRLSEVPTEFGPVTVEMRFAPGRGPAVLRLVPPARTPPARIVIHLEAWNERAPVVEAAGREVDLARPGLAADAGRPIEIRISPRS